MGSRKNKVLTNKKQTPIFKRLKQPKTGVKPVKPKFPRRKTRKPKYGEITK